VSDIFVSHGSPIVIMKVIISRPFTLPLLYCLCLVPGPTNESGSPSKVCQVRAKMGRDDVHPNTVSTLVQPRNVVAFSADLSAIVNERCNF
jgi:hypothetical protein